MSEVNLFQKTTDEKLLLNNRYYKNKLPEQGDYVMVKVNKIEKVAAYVQLLEYNNIEGMILLSDISRRRIRSIKKKLKVGNEYIMEVINVDIIKNCIDLSKKNINSNDISIKEYENYYHKYKKINSILIAVANKTKVRLNDLYKNIVWPLLDIYPDIFDAFKIAVSNPDEIFNSDIPDYIRNVLIDYIQDKFKKKPIKISANIELTCFTKAGIDGIITALKKGMTIYKELVNEKLVNEESDIKYGKIDVHLLSPPTYVIFTTIYDKEDGIKLLEKSISEINKSILTFGGNCKISKEPYVINEEDNLF